MFYVYTFDVSCLMSPEFSAEYLARCFVYVLLSPLTFGFLFLTARCRWAALQ